MAGSATAEQLTTEHRRLQLQLRNLTAAQVLALARGLPADTFVGEFDRLELALETLVQARRRESAGLAAAYYRAIRMTKGQGAAIDVRTAGRAAPEALRSSLRVTGPVAYKRAIAAGKTATQAAAIAHTMLVGSTSRHVLNGGRETILDTIKADARATGWERVTDGNPCAFCAMIASRGRVFKSEQSGGFRPHDHCGCSVEPRFINEPDISDRNREFRQLWNRTQREASAAGDLRRGTSNDALNAFRRAYSATS